MTRTDVHQIVVLGAGYAGMMATVRLARRTRRQNVRVTLVNPSDRFTERLRMHQVAAGQELAVHLIPDVLDGTGVEFRRASAVAVDPAAHRVGLDDGGTLHYDTLVYALGSATDTGLVPGSADHAWTLNGPRAAHDLSRRLAEVNETAGAVTVAGGGLTGVEAAVEIAESHPGLTVTLVSRERPGSMMGERARAHLERALDRHGIVRRTGVRVAKVLPDAVVLDDGEAIGSDVTLWTAGVRVPALAADSGIATDDKGLIVTDGTLRSVSHPEIYAAGDAAAVRMAWGQVHGTCQSGMPGGAYVADAIARRLRGRTVTPFRFGYFHQPVSLGRGDAVVQFTRADDTPKRWYLKGRAARIYKEMISGSPLKAYRLSKRMNLRAGLSNGGRATRRPA